MRKLTEEHKRKISTSRKRFLDANPDKVPYVLSHSSRKSWPEVFFEQLLIRSGITGWAYNYPFGRYRLDFAFPEIKVDVEIDGSTHFLLDSVKRIDAIRDETLAKSGWRVLRIDAKLLYDLQQHESVVKLLCGFINDSRIFGQLLAPEKKKHEPKVRGVGIKEYHSRINAEHVEKVLDADIDFTKQGWVAAVSKIVGVSPNKGGKWLKRYIPDLYDKAWKRNMGL